jgi:hypothetical protein
MQYPYVGVTGFMSSSEVEAVLGALPEKSRYSLMVGVLASSKTLKGEQGKWPGRYPAVERIGNIFVSDPRVVNLIHYATADRVNLSDQLNELVEIAGPCLQGFQLNISWPNPSDLEDVAKRKIRIVLQIGAKALEQSNSSYGFRELLDAYDGLITDVLIDPSGGLGKPFDTETARSRLAIIREYFPKLGFGVGGGLSAETIDIVTPLATEFPGLSIDAEGRLRTPQPEDRLDIDRAKQYVTRGFQIMG